MNPFKWLGARFKGPPKDHPMAGQLRRTADRQEKQEVELRRLRALQSELGAIRRRRT